MFPLREPAPPGPLDHRRRTWMRAAFALAFAFQVPLFCSVLGQPWRMAGLGVVMAATLSTLFIGRARSLLLLEARSSADASRARAQAIADAAFDGVIEVDAQGRVLDVNPAAEQLFGVDRAWALGRPLGVFIDWFARGGPPAEGEASGALPARGEVNGRRGCGSTFPVEVAVAAVGAGDRRRHAVLVRDVSAESRVTLELEASERRLRALAGATCRIVLELDGDGRYLNAWCDDESLLSRPREELLGRTIREALGDLAADQFLPVIRSVISSGQRLSYDCQLPARDGLHWFAAVVERVPSADGSSFTVVFTAQEITQRKQAEDALRLSEERYRLAARATSEALWDVTLPDIDIHWAEAAHQIFRGQPPSTLGDRFERILPQDRERVVLSLMSALMNGAESWQEEFLTRRADDTVAEVQDRAFIVRDENGVAFRLVGAMVDVTEHNAMQSQLVQSDRLASLGTLAAGVAHEINNPLAYATTNVGYALEELREAAAAGLPPPAEVMAALEEARDGARRVASIVRDLKLFSRPEVSTGGVSLNRVAESALNMAMNEIRHRARLETGLQHDLPLARGDELKLGQVVLNLIINATQALPEGQADRHRIRVRTRLDGRGWPALEVSDTGCGIPRENLKRIFDPFFTTKPVGVGTGLGLSICQGIIATLGGEISVESEVGHGTTFVLSLPPSDVAAQVEATPPEGPERSGHVLVVDDEPLIGRSLRRILAPQHQVEIASNVAEALELLDKAGSGRDYGVILCDLMMPDRNGIELYEQLLRERPELAGRMVIMTGGAFTPGASEFLSKFSGRRLEKPVDAAAVRRVVADMLARAA